MNRVAIFGVPRSGTSWLGEILNAHPEVKYIYQPTSDPAIGSAAQSIQDDPVGWDSWFALLEDTQSAELLCSSQRENNSYPSPNKMVNHTCIAFKEVRQLSLMKKLVNHAGCKIVFIIRDPVDTLTSWINSPNHWQGDTKRDEQIIYSPHFRAIDPASMYGLTGWLQTVDAAHEMATRNSGDVAIVRYEELIQNPMQHASALLKFSGLGHSDSVIEFVKHSTTHNHPSNYSVYRDMTKPMGQREYKLTQEQVNEVINIVGDKGLQQYLRVNQKEA